jgi:hypothetical protein
MKKPFLLIITIFIASVASIAQAQPQAPASLAESKTLAAEGGTAATKEASFDGTTWWNYVKVLAADNMEGRETGSPGLRKAQEYVVEQLKGAGLEPVGARSYYQPVRFESRQIVEQESSLELVHNGQVEPLTLGDDAIFSTRVDLAPALDAPLVFAGYGLTIPELGHDDLSGLDVRDKVVVIFPGAPAEIPGALASHYQSAGERWKTLPARTAQSTAPLYGYSWLRSCVARSGAAAPVRMPEAVVPLPSSSGVSARFQLCST